VPDGPYAVCTKDEKASKNVGRNLELVIFLKAEESKGPI
jgi:hypothetical protein